MSDRSAVCCLRSGEQNTSRGVFGHSGGLKEAGNRARLQGEEVAGRGREGWRGGGPLVESVGGPTSSLLLENLSAFNNSCVRTGRMAMFDHERMA